MLNIFKQRLVALGVFVATTCLLLNGVLSSPGIPMGNDWGFPLTQVQIKTLSDIVNSTWQFSNFISFRNSNLSTSVFFKMWEIVASLGIPGDLLCKAFLFFIYVFVGFSLFELLRMFKVGLGASVLGGIIFITTPLFFNYTIMGWVMVLFVLGLMAVAMKYFILSVRGDDASKAVFVAIVVSVAFWQSQSIVWFSILFLLLSFYVVIDRKSFISCVQKLALIVGLFLVLNLHILLPLLAVPDQTISGSDYAQSSTSLGTVAHFYPTNILRLFGSLFNFQYETVMNSQKFSAVSWLLPLMAIGGLFSRHPRRVKLLFLMIAIIPVFMFGLNQIRGILAYIPFSNVIRDFARFTVFSCFGFSVLAAMFLDELFEAAPSGKKYISVGLILVTGILAIYPWWSGEMVNWKSSATDSRLRTKIFPKEYFEVERMMAAEKLDARVLYWPFGGGLEYLNDPKFQGAYHAAWDIFGLYSPLPGAFVFSDRKLVNKTIQTQIINSFSSRTVSSWVGNLKYVVVKKDSISEGVRVDPVGQSRELGRWLERLYESNSIDVYRTKTFSPSFVAIQRVIVSDLPVETFVQSIANGQFQPTLAVLESKETSEIFSSREVGPQNAQLEFRKLGVTRYAVKAHNASNLLVLLFRETFNHSWRVYPSRFPDDEKTSLDTSKLVFASDEWDQASIEELKNFVANGWVDVSEKRPLKFISKNFQGTIQNDNLRVPGSLSVLFSKSLNEKNHVRANGFLNSWVIDAEALCQDSSPGCRKIGDNLYELSFIVEFFPQRVFRLGLLIAGLSFLSCIIFIFVKSARKRGARGFHA